jgi:hypothetical protein
VPELKLDHRAVLKAPQFGKQIADLHFELELLAIAEFRPLLLSPNRATRTTVTVESRIG